jgi:hypothetical protein
LDAEAQAKKDAETYGGNWWDYLAHGFRGGDVTKFPPKGQGGEILKNLEDFNQRITGAGDRAIAQLVATPQLPPELKQPTMQPIGQVGGNAEELAQAGRKQPPIAPVSDTGSTGQVPSWYTAPRPQEANLPKAPVEAGEPETSPWSRYGTNPQQLPRSTTPPAQAPEPSLFQRLIPFYPTVSAERTRPGGGGENPEIGSFANTPPRLAYQEHVDQLAPGQRFIWHHNNAEYIKT